MISTGLNVNMNMKVLLIGTDLLPPHLDLFNYSESESLQSFPNTPHESPDVSQPDTPSPDPPPLPFQEPGPSSAFPSKQLSDIRKLPKACHSLKVSAFATICTNIDQILFLPQSSFSDLTSD